MITQDVNISRCDWVVHLYYSVSRPSDVDEVLDNLSLIDCPQAIIRRARKTLSMADFDTGITFTNSSLRETIIVVREASSPAEFFNSITHESRHLEAHIAKALGLDPFGEEICYIAGEFAKSIYPLTKLFLCDGGSCQNQVESS